jgi:hypothetical protein
MAEALETIGIPATNLNPTRIALGTWAIGGWMWGGSDEAESARSVAPSIVASTSSIRRRSTVSVIQKKSSAGRLRKLGRTKP